MMVMKTVVMKMIVMKTIVMKVLAVTMKTRLFTPAGIGYAYKNASPRDRLVVFSPGVES